MFLALPFIEQLQIPSIIDKALQKVSIDSKTGATYNSFDVLMTLLLGFLLKCETYDDIHATLGGYKSLGVWLGKDKQRLPSIEIIKEHVRQLATPYFIKDLKRLLSHSVAKAGIVDLGVLYIDSHFMAYYGKHNISKGYSTIRRLALRGTYHHFVGDRQGRPVTFYLTEGAVRLHRTLTALLKDVQYLRQKHDPDRPLFLVFDREIYDAKLFKRLDRKQIVFLTYIKNASEYPDEKFKKTITVPFRTKFTEYELFATYTSISGYHDRVKALVIRNPDTKPKTSA